MSMPAIFFTATNDIAKSVHLNHTLPTQDAEELGDIDILKMSLLWALIEGREWEVDMMDHFREVYSTSDEWLYRVPNELMEHLSKLDPARQQNTAAAWAETEEMACDSSEALEVIKAAIKVATRAQTTSRGMFLYFSL